MLPPILPRTRWTPLVVVAVSVAALGWGVLRDSGGLVTIGAIGIGVALLAFVIAPRLLGAPGDDPPEPPPSSPPAP